MLLSLREWLSWRRGMVGPVRWIWREYERRPAERWEEKRTLRPPPAAKIRRAGGPAVADGRNGSRGSSQRGVESDRSWDRTRRLDAEQERALEDVFKRIQRGERAPRDSEGWDPYAVSFACEALARRGDVAGIDAVLSWFQADGRSLRDDRPIHARMKALVSRRREAELLPTYRDMMRQKVPPSPHICGYLLSALVKARRLDEVDQVSRDMLLLGMVPTTPIFNVIIDAYVRQGEYKRAAALYHSMLDRGLRPDIVTFGSLTRLHARQGDDRSVLLHLEGMKSQGVAPDVTTYGGIIHGFAKSGHLEKAWTAWEMMQEAGIEPNVIVLNSLLDGYAKVQDRGNCTKVWELYDTYRLSRTSSSYSSLLNAQWGDVEASERVFKEMEEVAGIRPDLIAFSSLLRTYNRAGAVAQAASLFARMQRECRHLDLHSFRPIIDLHSRVGDPLQALSLLEEVRRRRLPGVSRLLHLVTANLTARDDEGALLQVRQRFGTNGDPTGTRPSEAAEKTGVKLAPT